MVSRAVLPAVLAVLLFALHATAQSDSTSATKMPSQDLADWIDQRFAKQYEAAGIEPGALVDDATFLRRIYLDLQGRIPTVAQVRDFLQDDGSFRRENYVDRLLNDNARPDRFAKRTSENLARVWRRMMIPSSAPGAAMATQLEPWLAKQFAENAPYDEFARKLILATNNPNAMRAAVPIPNAQPISPDASAAFFEQALGASPENLASGYVRVFLGVRLNCAQCHDHPFTEWKQKDFWGVAAMFSGDNAKQDASRPAPVITPPDNTSVSYTAKLMWASEPLKEIPANRTSRELLAEWLVSPQNPNFAATAVNRTWQYLCGRGLAGSVDELDRLSPEERAMLDDLAKLFVESGYDIRWLVSGICKSKTYRQSVAATPSAEDGFIHRPLKTLLPEQVFDSLEQALNLPIAKVDGGPRFNGEREQFVARMNEAAPDSPADYKGGIPQALMLMNGKLTADATSLETSRTLRAVVEAPFLSTEGKIEAMYLATLSRKPSENEINFLMKHVNAQTNTEQRQALAEIMWGLVNSPEFVLSR
jgi:hypothetical protein